MSKPDKPPKPKTKRERERVILTPEQFIARRRTAEQRRLAALAAEAAKRGEKPLPKVTVR